MVNAIFERAISVKLSKEQHEKIVNIVNKNQDAYNNISHFIRCAVIKELRTVNQDELLFRKEESLQDN